MRVGLTVGKSSKARVHFKENMISPKLVYKIKAHLPRSVAAMDKTSSTNSIERLLWLHATDPELLATLHEIHHLKRTIRRLSRAVSRSVSSELTWAESESVIDCSDASSTSVHECDEDEALRLKRTSTASTRTLKPRKARPDKSFLQAVLPQDAAETLPRPKSALAEQQQQQQLFLNRRAALYRPTTQSLNFRSDYSSPRDPMKEKRR